MKKLLIAIAAISVFAFAGCSNSDNISTETEVSNSGSYSETTSESDVIDEVDEEVNDDVMSAEDVEILSAWMRLGYDYNKACELVKYSKIYVHASSDVVMWE